MSRQYSSEVLSCIREERRGTKKYFRTSSSSLLWPRWVAWCVWLTRVGGSSSGTNNLPLGNSYHPFSVLMAPSTLASWFWASVYFGESSVSSGSSTNTRALIGASLVTLKPSAACLVVLTGQESCSSAGNCQADEQTLITQLSRPGSRD